MRKAKWFSSSFHSRTSLTCMAGGTTTARRTVGCEHCYLLISSMIYEWIHSGPPQLSFCLCAPVRLQFGLALAHETNSFVTWIWFGSVVKWNIGEIMLVSQRKATKMLIRQRRSFTSTDLMFWVFPFLMLCVVTWGTIWQVWKTRGTGGRTAHTSLRPANVGVPCCTTWLDSSQGEENERSTWVEWVLLPVFNTVWWAHFFFYPRGKTIIQEVIRHVAL